MKLSGVLVFHSETGTEGGHWGFQDEKWMHAPGEECWSDQYCPAQHGGEAHWDYRGLHLLKTGDFLTVWDDGGDYAACMWRGYVDLSPFTVFKESSGGLWIHNHPENDDLDDWTSMFLQERRADLTTQDNDGDDEE